MEDRRLVGACVLCRESSSRQEQSFGLMIWCLVASAAALFPTNIDESSSSLCMALATIAWLSRNWYYTRHPES